MKAEQKLETIFSETVSGFVNNNSTARNLWQDVEKRYTRSSRHYHNLAHLDHLVNTLLQVKQKIRDWDITIVAIAYHDIIYSTRNSDNEERSVAYADRVLSGILPEEKRKLLSQFIMATKAHDRNENEDINYFTDADLSILGAKPEEYRLYTKQIRSEYKLYPMFIYKPGRAKVLRHFLNMSTIFKTDFFNNQLEKGARENLQRELNELSR